MLLALITLIVVLFTVMPVSAEEREISVIIDGKPMTFSHDQGYPVITEGRTLVPLRAIFEALGVGVKWNPQAQSIEATKGDINIYLVLDYAIAYVSGTSVKLDVPPTILGGNRTYVPLRFVSEALGGTVKYIGGANPTITITSPQESVQPTQPTQPTQPATGTLLNIYETNKEYKLDLNLGHTSDNFSVIQSEHPEWGYVEDFYLLVNGSRYDIYGLHPDSRQLISGEYKVMKLYNDGNYVFVFSEDVMPFGHKFRFYLYLPNYSLDYLGSVSTDIGLTDADIGAVSYSSVTIGNKPYELSYDPIEQFEEPKSPTISSENSGQIRIYNHDHRDLNNFFLTVEYTYDSRRFSVTQQHLFHNNLKDRYVEAELELDDNGYGRLNVTNYITGDGEIRIINPGYDISDAYIELDFQHSDWHRVGEYVDLAGGDRFYQLNAHGGTKIGDIWYGDFLRPSF